MTTMLSNKVKVSCNKRIKQYPKDFLPLTTVINEPNVIPLGNESKHSIPADKEISPKNVLDISLPQPNSTNCVAKQIKEVEALTCRKVKSMPDLPQYQRISYEENVTKQMNFPFNKRLYKELISLNSVEKEKHFGSTSASISYERNIRNVMPRLEDFFMPNSKPEFDYRATDVHTNASRSTQRHYDGQRLYQLMNTWETTAFTYK